MPGTVKRMYTTTVEEDGGERGSGEGGGRDGRGGGGGDGVSVTAAVERMAGGG